MPSSSFCLRILTSCLSRIASNGPGNKAFRLGLDTGLSHVTNTFAPQLLKLPAVRLLTCAMHHVPYRDAPHGLPMPLSPWPMRVGDKRQKTVPAANWPVHGQGGKNGQRRHGHLGH